jgi:hypothetical protein
VNGKHKSKKQNKRTQDQHQSANKTKKINRQTKMLLLPLCGSGDHANAKLPRTLQQIFFLNYKLNPNG